MEATNDQAPAPEGTSPEGTTETTPTPAAEQKPKAKATRPKRNPGQVSARKLILEGLQADPPKTMEEIVAIVKAEYPNRDEAKIKSQISLNKGELKKKAAAAAAPAQ